MIGPIHRPASVLFLLAGTACFNAAPIDMARDSIETACADRLAGPSRLVVDALLADQGRSVPVEIHLPGEPGSYPLIGFSHGALAAPDRYRRMLEPIAAAGYIVVAPMHLESEEFEHEVDPSPPQIWYTRVEDMEIALNPPQSLIAKIEGMHYFIDGRYRIAMGHSFGALIAQLAGGARGYYPDGKQIAFEGPRPAGTVAWSPPGVMPGKIEADGWATLSGQAMVLTGTQDVLSQVRKEWEWHLEGYEAIPPGRKTLWIGDGIDHYFGGSFGREKIPDGNSSALFERALAEVLSFIDHTTGRPSVCRPGPSVEGERIVRD